MKSEKRQHFRFKAEDCSDWSGRSKKARWKME